jgi:hypothetical protein
VKVSSRSQEQLLQERRHPGVLFDVGVADRVRVCCPGALVAPYSGHQQGGLVTVCVVGSCPSVQLALVVEQCVPLGEAGECSG